MRPRRFGIRETTLLAALLLAGGQGVAAAATPADAPSVATASAATVAPPAASSPLPPQGQNPLDAADLSAWLDGRVPYALKAGDIAGAVVIVVKDGKVLLEKGYGYADVAARRPMDPAQTLVRPGSTSKLFTWTAVMQLVQQGKLDLHRDVNDYLDFKVPEVYGKPITLLDLMNHRAGFEEGLKDVLGYDPQQAQTNEQYLKNHPRAMLFAPGSIPAYSNYGAALAGYIVQRVSGEPFDAYVAHHIFEPLGMTHSTVAQPLPERFQASMSKGYRTASDEQPSPFELVITAPAGSASVTASDMGRFMLAHLQQGQLDGHAILDPATTAAMHQPSQAVPSGFGTMAHGFFSATQNGHALLGHGGDTIVFHTEMELLPQDNVGIFFTFNSRGKDSAVYIARKELFDGFMNRYFPAPALAEPAALPSAREDAQAIAGRYQSSRRVEHGFLSVLYLLDQTVITANPDGTINVPDQAEQRALPFREIAPSLWRAVGGTRELLLSEPQGVKTIADSDNPVGVLQASPVARSAPLTLSVLAFSIVVLLSSLVYGGMQALARRANGPGATADRTVARWRRVQRVAIVVDIAYLLAWCLFIRPVLSTDIALYQTGNDWIVRLLQAGGLAAIAAAVAATWAAWRLLRSGGSRLTRIWSVAVALASIGVIWIAFAGGLLSWSVNY